MKDGTAAPRGLARLAWTLLGLPGCLRLWILGLWPEASLKEAEGRCVQGEGLDLHLTPLHIKLFLISETQAHPLG